jgi:hypothetical protein
VGADIDDPLAPGSTIPVLFALEREGGLVWGSTMGFEPNVTVGASSPAVVQGYDDGNYALFSASDGIVQIGEGVSCPTDDLAFECSGHGTCNCASGQCACSPTGCWGGGACANQCANGGRCSDALGGCVCANSNYDTASLCKQCDPCHTGPDTGCQAPTNLCNYHGQCVVAGGLPTCRCEAGWGGMGCTVNVGAQVQQAEDIGAAVGVPIALVLVAVAGIFYMRRTGTTFSDLVPRQLLSRLAGGRRAGGGAAGVSFTASGSSSGGGGGDAVATGNALYATAAKAGGSEGGKLLGGKSYGSL